MVSGPPTIAVLSAPMPTSTQAIVSSPSEGKRRPTATA